MTEARPGRRVVHRIEPALPDAGVAGSNHDPIA
jgi:hypothetical protein